MASFPTASSTPREQPEEAGDDSSFPIIRKLIEEEKRRQKEIELDHAENERLRVDLRANTNTLRDEREKLRAQTDRLEQLLSRGAPAFLYGGNNEPTTSATTLTPSSTATRAKSPSSGIASPKSPTTATTPRFLPTEGTRNPSLGSFRRGGIPPQEG